ncbi:MAG: hypothetical protein F4X54_04665 [Chloroflexi bacterium]|nr:hypothetical protein [Chloroflexota bacterium]
MRRAASEVDAVDRLAELAQAVNDATADAALVHKDRLRAPRPQRLLHLVDQPHRIHLRERAQVEYALSLPHADGRLVETEPPDVHANVDGQVRVEGEALTRRAAARRPLPGGEVIVVIPAKAGISQPRRGQGRGSCLRRNDEGFPALHGGLDRLAAHERVLLRVRELGEDGGGVEGVVLRPVEGELLGVLGSDGAGYAAVLAGEVRSVVRGDPDAPVDVLLGVVGVVELAVERHGVAKEQEALRVQPLDGVHLVLGHGVRLRDDDEQVLRVETLDVARLVGGEADGEPVLVDAVLRGEHLPS